MTLKSLVFNFLEDGSTDCHFQEEAGPTYSFDPAQMPDKAKSLLSTALKAALVSKVTAEADAATLRADNDAKDGNIQELLAQVADLEAKAQPVV